MTNAEVATMIARDLIAERRARLDAKIEELRNDPETDYEEGFFVRLRARGGWQRLFRVPVWCVWRRSKLHRSVRLWERMPHLVVRNQPGLAASLPSN